jgi:hypothetical protein
VFLADGHRADLMRSGLSADTIARAGIYSAPGPEISALLGYGAGAGMVFPYPALNGGPPYSRVKLDQPDPAGKRYRSPKAQVNRLYIPALLDPAVLEDARTALWVTEGEKKALKACQEGLSCIAVSGVWSWRTKDEAGHSRALAELDHIAWRDRTVYLVFDSDADQKAGVAAAERAFGAELAGRGAFAWAVRLPAGPHGAKCGLDDYLCTHSVEALCQIEPVRLALDPPTTRLEVIDLPDLLTRAFPPRQNLIGPALLIRQGLAVIGGAPRIGKSLLCCNLALCRALDRPWCGFPLEPGVTVYLQAEIPEARLQERLQLMVKELAHPPIPAQRLLTITRRRVFLDQPAGRDLVIRVLDELACRLPVAPDLLILDPLARFYSGEENSQKDVGRFVETLDALVERFQLALLIPHHPSKPTKGDPKEGGAKLRGMSGLWAAADGTWWLSRSHDGITLSFEDLRHGEPPAPLYLERSPGLWYTPSAAPTDERLAAVRHCVLGIGLAWSKLLRAVMADLDVSESTAKRLVTAAAADGLIVKGLDGIYREGPKGQQGPSGT